MNARHALILQSFCFRSSLCVCIAKLRFLVQCEMEDSHSFVSKYIPSHPIHKLGAILTLEFLRNET